jgi:uncharacterized protein YndB with AHSA1/START domain
VPAPFQFDRTWAFPTPVERLWEAVSDTRRFPSWFPWLDADHLGPLEAGTVARFRVSPPLPYRLHLEVAVQRVEPGRLVEALVGGDVAGPARLDVAADGDGSTARLSWTLQVRRPMLVLAERVARPVMLWGHDTVVDQGVRRFGAAIDADPRPR